jgi:FlaA1/EpsC-like NDP-sugar epimerase
MLIKNRKLMLIIADVVFINLAIYLALLVRFDSAVPQRYIDCFIHNILIITVIHIVIFSLFGLYRSLWEYASIEEMMQIALSAVAATGLSFAAGLAIGDRLPITVYFMGCNTDMLARGREQAELQVPAQDKAARVREQEKARQGNDSRRRKRRVHDYKGTEKS